MIYSVKPTGGNGSGIDDANAWSVAKYNASVNSLAPGDTVKFKNGETYFGVLNVKSGTQGNPIIIDTYGAGAPAVISGFVVPTNWALLSGNVYYATVNASLVHIVTLDGVMKGYGRYPKTGYLTYTSHSGNTSITSSAIGKLPANFTGGEVVIKKYRYILDRHKITGQAKNTITYNANNFFGQNGNYEPTDGNGFFIQNHLSTVTQEGDWYFDAAAKRLYMHFGAGTPDGRVVKASTLGQLVGLNSSQFITFNNIDFEGANFGVVNNGTNSIIFNNCNFRQLSTGVYLADSKNVQVNGGSMVDHATNGYFSEIGGTNLSIIGVKLDRNGLIPGLGESGDGKYNGLAVNGNGTVIRNCVVKNTGFNGINFSGNDALVENNTVDTFCVVKDDGSGIYTFADQKDVCSNRTIRNNTVLNGIGNTEGALSNGQNYGQAAGIYLDGNSNHTEVSGNTVAYGPWLGIFVNGNSDNQVLNNTVFGFWKQFAILAESLSGNRSVRRLVVTGNKFIARQATEKTFHLSLFVDDNPANMGTFDNNVYARPLDDNATMNIFKQVNGQTSEADISLSAWKQNFKQDANSQGSQVTTSKLSDLRFEYNNSNQSKVVPLGAAYKTPWNVPYSDSLTVPPFGSAVLVYTGEIAKPIPVPPVPVPPVPTPTPVTDVITGSIFINGKEYKLVPVQ